MSATVRHLAFALALGTFAGCSERESAAEPTGVQAETEAAGNPWIRQAQAAHALADSATDEAGIRHAEEALKAFADTDAPAQIHADDRNRLVLDAYYRLSSLALQREDAEAALAYSDAGLSIMTEPTEGPDRVFVANLLVMKGQALERLSREVEATEPYFEALEINRELLNETLEGSP